MGSETLRKGEIRHRAWKTNGDKEAGKEGQVGRKKSGELRHSFGTWEIQEAMIKAMGDSDSVLPPALSIKMFISEGKNAWGYASDARLIFIILRTVKQWDGLLYIKRKPWNYLRFLTRKL